MFKALGCVLMALSVQAASAVKVDPPDLTFERKLHRDFLRRSGQPAGNGVATNSDSVVNYRLQRGENLWGLSHMLYGDGNYWPKVWAQNQSIANPHLIRPGYSLQLYLGNEDETPAFRFSEHEDSTGLELAANSSVAQVEIPPPEIQPKPVIKIPSSFPAWQSVFETFPEDVEIDSRGIVMGEKNLPDKILLTAWVQENPITPIGEFIEGESESTLAVENQHVYIKMRKGVAQSGMRLLVVRDAGPIKKLNTKTEFQAARLIHVTGEVILTESVIAKFADGESKDYDAYRALVTRATGLSLKDCSVIAGSLQQIDMAYSNNPAPVDGLIIGSANHQASALFGTGAIVFVNRGSTDGLTVGHTMEIFPDRRLRKVTTPVPFSVQPSGRIKIVKVSDRVSTAVVLKSRESIQPGDSLQRIGSSVIYTDDGTGTPLDSGSSSGGEEEFDPSPASGDSDSSEEGSSSDESDFESEL